MMSELSITPESLTAAAGEFHTAGDDLLAILKRLDETTGGLQEQWEGAAQQAFFKKYQELRQYMEAFSILLDHISTEMNAMAERYDSADQ